MGKNQIINNKAENSLKEPPKTKKKRRLGKAAHTILDGSFLTRESFMKLMPFLIYVMFLAIVHVANSYRAEKTWFEINQIRAEMDELRYRYITSKSRLMYLGKQSELLLRFDSTGLKELTAPPVRLKSDQIDNPNNASK